MKKTEHLPLLPEEGCLRSRRGGGSGVVLVLKGLMLACCLSAAGCGLIQIGVSNSPDYCPNKDSKACL
jgi:hypothetical protein